MYEKLPRQQLVPFIPIGMGIIQHEWIDLYETTPACPIPITLTPTPCPGPIQIKINFHPRCSR